MSENHLLGPRFYYVYRLTCTHPSHAEGPKYYYGWRCSKVPPEQDTLYVSSSRLVKDTIKHLGREWFKKKILACYSTKQEAIEKEVLLHAYFDVKSHPLFFNRANQTSSGFVTGEKLTEAQKQKLREKATGKKHSLESRKKMSQQRRGKKRKPLSLEHKEKIRKALLGKHHSPATRQKMIDTRKKLVARNQTDATKQKISQKMKQVSEERRLKNQIYKCPHCGKEGKAPGIFVWHFTHCNSSHLEIPPFSFRSVPFQKALLFG